MFSKVLLALPFASLALASPVAAQTLPKPSIVAPAEIAANPANRLTLVLSNGKTVVIQLRPDVAPLHVERIQTLVRRGFYDGLSFHRVIPGFMAQGGDPKNDGTGGSELPDLKAEFTEMPYMRGTAAMARSNDENSANSQFFIMFSPNVGLWGKYTVFGRVISGMDAVDAIAVGEPPEQPTTIVQARLGDMAAAAVPVAPAAVPTTTDATPNGG